MPTPSPFPFLDDVFAKVRSGLQPPPWMIDEVQRRVVLLVNHVLMQEPEARARLVRQAGRVAEARWRAFTMRVAVTPAGLFDLASTSAVPDLTLTLTEDSPLELAQAAFRGDKPPVRIAGDVQFAAEINWLVENVRWDLEEDLSRLVGDAPAHAVGEAVRRAIQALRQFAAPSGGPPRAAATGPAQAAPTAAASPAASPTPAPSTGAPPA